jgi:amidohydrolase
MPIRRLASLAPVLALALPLPAVAAIERADLEREFAAVKDQLIAWRRDIHQNPELGNRETRTAALVAEVLRGLKLDSVRTGVGVTGVVGILEGGKPGPVIALRADMDALPVTEQTGLPFASKVTTTFRGETVGVMHACGHDTHVANLLATATVLSRLRADLPGTVMFIFQPAEEGAPDGEEGGAALMLKEGLFADRKPGAVMGLHVTSNLNTGRIGWRSGPLMAAVDSFTITVKGVQTHGSRPWQGVDPITAAAQIVTGVNTIVSRQLDITDTPAVISFGAIKGGIRENIIPDQVEMIGTIRTFQPEHRVQIFDRLKRTVENIAASQGASATVDIQEGYPVTVNEQRLTERMLPTLRRVAGEANVVRVPLTTGAEDFSYYAQEVPGLFVFVGVTDPAIDPRKAPTNHSPLFLVDEAALPLALDVLVSLAVDYLQGG